MTMKLDTIVIVLAVTAATFQTGYLLADSSQPDAAVAEAPVTDTAITRQIHNAYRLESGLAATKVSIKTIHGTVRLAGVVESEAEAAQAEDIASRVGGVREVRSHIRVLNRNSGETIATNAL
jgi:osmotically-inducible protein OsmY